jgi:hypothetical protein
MRNSFGLPIGHKGAKQQALFKSVPYILKSLKKHRPWFLQHDMDQKHHDPLLILQTYQQWLLKIPTMAVRK